MLKKPLVRLFTVAFIATALSACVSEPVDPSFAGAAAVDKEEASKNRVSLGLTYLQTGEFSRAKANLDKALDFTPESANANFAMAYYYQQVDELRLADEYYNRALRFDSDNADIINSYGAFLCEQGKYENAKSYFLEAVNNKSYISTAETYENLGICAQSQGRPDEAASFYSSALNHQPTRSRSLFLLAQLQAEKGNYEEAKKTLWKYDRVAQVSPQSLWLSFEIAEGLGDMQSALGYGEIMKSMYPNHPNTIKFKQQMGVFQPRANITSKRSSSLEGVSAQVVASPTPEKAISPAVTSGDLNQGDESSMVVMKKKSKTLSPSTASPSTASASTTSASTGSTLTLSAETVNVVADTTDASATPEPQTVSVSDDDYAKREAELAAAFDTGVTDVFEQSDSVADKAEVQTQAQTKEPDITNDNTEELIPEDVAQVETSTSVSEPVFHVVLPKENLYQISLRYNVQMKYLMEWNELDDASSIRIGTKLWVKDPNNND